MRLSFYKKSIEHTMPESRRTPLNHTASDFRIVRRARNAQGRCTQRACFPLPTLAGVWPISTWSSQCPLPGAPVTMLGLPDERRELNPMRMAPHAIDAFYGCQN